MKTIFNPTTKEELINRVNTLNEDSKAQWGQMNIYQMLKHCTLWEEMIHGKNIYKRMFIGRIFGRLALKAVLKDDQPLKQSTPTIPELKITGHGIISDQKKEWIKRIEQYDQFSNDDFVHVFFGKMTREQIGRLVYKHIDHHLRQFKA